MADYRDKITLSFYEDVFPFGFFQLFTCCGKTTLNLCHSKIKIQHSAFRNYWNRDKPTVLSVRQKLKHSVVYKFTTLGLVSVAINMTSPGRCIRWLLEPSLSLCPYASPNTAQKFVFMNIRTSELTKYDNALRRISFKKLFEKHKPIGL